MTVPYEFTTVAALRDEIFRKGLTQYIAVKIGHKEVSYRPADMERMMQIAEVCDATIVYSHYREREADGRLTDHPLIDYQFGSVRDDFDFGSIVLLNTADVLSATEDFEERESAYKDGGWYAMRLRMTLGRVVVCIPEYLYTVEKTDFRHSGEKQHDYVDPRQREYQEEMEECITQHLYEIDALLPEEKEHPDLNEGLFPVTASVIIPVRNRVKTIGDAVRSALAQEADFQFNVIVVDNGSTDGTSEVLAGISDPRLCVISLDGTEGLGIGGCWNEAVNSQHCGRFAVQLDSDDLYSGTGTLRRIVDKFYEEGCGMVIGSYLMTDAQLRPIPPGIINHREWTDANGANNALRINGFGAPRAFFTPLLRRYPFPNVSDGEDYAVALRLSRDYAVGRIYDPLYLCRRWDGNSDAHLSIETVNRHNEYKDFIRSVELMARMGQTPEEEVDEG